MYKRNMFDVIIIVLNFDCDNIIRENYDYYVYILYKKVDYGLSFVKITLSNCTAIRVYNIYIYKYIIYTLHVKMRYIIIDRRTLYVYLHII